MTAHTNKGKSHFSFSGKKESKNFATSRPEFLLAKSSGFISWIRGLFLSCNNETIIISKSPKAVRESHLSQRHSS
jgi:hypothetical protein